MRIIFWGITAIFTFLVGVYVESLSSEKLLFFNCFLASEICDSILQHPLIVISVLGTVQFLIYIFSFHYIENKDEETHKKISKNICKNVFDNIIRKNANGAVFRVSLLKACDKIEMINENGEIKWKGWSSEKHLKVVARFQIRQDQKSTKVIFKTGQGCVGLCYRTATIIQKNISYYDINNPGKYLKESSEEFKLPKHKAKKLNEKASVFLCVPVKYFDSDDLYGVLSIDSTDKVEMKKILTHTRSIEEILQHSSISFIKP